MSVENDEEHRNFIEARMIIQEFHDDPTVFIVGTAPFGKLWFDHEKIDQQYKVLTDSWFEEYGDNETQHSKKPRIISILLDEKDSMFNRYRENIREAQEKKQLESAGKSEQLEDSNQNENVVMDISQNSSPVNNTETSKKTNKKKKNGKEEVNKIDNKSERNSGSSSPTKGKRGRPKKQQTDIKEAFGKPESLTDI